MITFQVLGDCRGDNALLVRVDVGNRLVRLLFDCGQGCLDDLSRSEIAAIDHLLFSHFHMDHVCGFDGFFRINYNRDRAPIRVWGPPGTIDILHHRFRGFVWNLVENQPGEWQVTDIEIQRTTSASFFTSESFRDFHPLGERPIEASLVDDPDLTIHPVHLDHGIPSIGYLIRETDHLNVDPEALAESGLSPGPWLQSIKDGRRSDGESIDLNGSAMSIGRLRETLLVETPGDSLAYLTDFDLRSDTDLDRLAMAIRGCRTLVCEAQYLERDLHLARLNHHMTAARSARLAKLADVDRLVLFHLSDRYGRDELGEFMHEARAIFPATTFPANWRFTRWEDDGPAARDDR